MRLNLPKLLSKLGLTCSSHSGSPSQKYFSSQGTAGQIIWRQKWREKATVLCSNASVSLLLFCSKRDLSQGRNLFLGVSDRSKIEQACTWKPCSLLTSSNRLKQKAWVAQLGTGEGGTEASGLLMHLSRKSQQNSTPQNWLPGLSGCEDLVYIQISHRAVIQKFTLLIFTANYCI